MALAFGEKTVSKAYFGEKAVSAIYLGTKKVFPDEELPATGDIRLRIETTSANQSFRLFSQIRTEEGGYVSVDWGDGNKETLTGKTTYSPVHTYATAGEYVVKLTGSKFTGVNGSVNNYEDFQTAIREILSLKMPKDSTGVSLVSTFRGCANLTGSIPAWGANIKNAQNTYYGCKGLTGNIPAWGESITIANYTYRGCSGLTGSIPEWGANITNAIYTYSGCKGLTGNIPEWGANIKNADATYEYCSGLTGEIPAWGANISSASRAYSGCSGLTGSIPEWGAKITVADYTYYNCTGLTGCSEELLQDPMPSRITKHNSCVTGCVDEIRQHFTPEWGGTKEEFQPETGDIRLRIETTSANQSFPLFYQITTEEGGYVSVDWGDGNKETLTGKTTYSPVHTYATAGEYVVKLTGSKFTTVDGQASEWSPYTNAVREILSLKMPTDSTSVALRFTFGFCYDLTGSIPEWDDCITNAQSTYYGCTGLTGNIPEWGSNITNAYYTYYGCTGLTGNIPAWGANITNAGYTYMICTGLVGSVPAWGVSITNATDTYRGCSGLTGNIPAWGSNITEATGTYRGCSGLTGNIPAWGSNITEAAGTYNGCSGLTGNIPAWGSNITNVANTYWGCTGLTGNIPAWGSNITRATGTYRDCSGLTGCSEELLQDPMPSRITEHAFCVTGCAGEIRKHFTGDWGGTKPGA